MQASEQEEGKEREPQTGRSQVSAQAASCTGLPEAAARLGQWNKPERTGRRRVRTVPWEQHCTKPKAGFHSPGKPSAGQTFFLRTLKTC